MTATAARPTTTATDAPPSDDVPVRLALGRFRSFRAAERAVERLESTEVPPGAVHVVASHLQRPRSARSDALVRGLATGATLGAVFALVWWMTGMADAGPFISLVFGAVGGAILGGVAVLVAAWLADKDNEAVEVGRFDVLVDRRYEATARAVIDEM